MPTTTAAEETREARIARMKARRAERPVYGPEEVVPVCAVKPGDFVVHIDGESNLRGLTIGMVVVAAWADDERYRRRTETGGWVGVEATWLKVTGHPAVAYPSEFKATVRRTAK